MKQNSLMSRRQALSIARHLGGAAGGLVALHPSSSLAETIRQACGLTPPQAEGPFYPVKDQADKDNDLTVVRGASGQAQGQVIYVQGKVMDESCAPIAGALVEIWQACASGRYNHPGDDNPAPLDPNFQYWGRAVSDANGDYAFKTIVPGAYPADTDWIRPPHIHFKVHRRGYLELTTQMYFEGNPYNASDKILGRIPAAERAKVVRPIEASEYCRFDLTLQRA